MLTRTPPADLASLSAAMLGARLVLLTWRDPDGATPFMPHLDGALLPRPFAASLVDPAGGMRAGLLRLPEGASGGALLATAAPSSDPPPCLPVEAFAPDPAGLLAALPAPARWRVLGFMLDVGSGLMRAGRDGAFLRTCRRLAAAEASGAEASGAEASARPLAAGGPLLLAELAGGTAPHWLHLGARTVRRPPCAVVGGRHFVLLSGASSGELLIAADGEAPPRRLVPARGSLPHLLGVLPTLDPEASGAIAALVRERLAVRAAEDTAAASLLRELDLILPRPPRRHASAASPVAGAVELALADRGGGMFLRGWLRDPLGLVATMAVRGPAGEMPVPPGALFRVPRPDLAAGFTRARHGGDAPEGFVAHLPAFPGAGPQPDVLLRLASGAEVHLVPPLRTLPAAAAREAVLASVAPPEATDAVMDGCIAPAAARLHAAALAGPRAPEVLRFGQAPRRPRVSVLIPLYRTLSFLRAQFAAFACDPAWAEVETILVLDSPEQRAELEHLLRGLTLMFGLSATLVVMPRNLGYAAANNAGAAVARAPLLLLLNSDVVPERAGWLTALAAPLADRRVGATGARLLFEDGSLQHAGLHFAQEADGTWFNRHYHKGFPRDFAPAARARAVPAVTGAALLVRRALFERVAGVTEDYIIGDYEDSDLCLKLRAAGGGIAYAPAATLWHFERRSIRQHSGYARTLASLYNRRLHSARWGQAIARLMRRFPQDAAA